MNPDNQRPKPWRQMILPLLIGIGIGALGLALFTSVWNRSVSSSSRSSGAYGREYHQDGSKHGGPRAERRDGPTHSPWAWLPWLFPFWGFRSLVPLALIGLGAWLLLRNRRATRDVPPVQQANTGPPTQRVEQERGGNDPETGDTQRL